MGIVEPDEERRRGMYGGRQFLIAILARVLRPLECWVTSTDFSQMQSRYKSTLRESCTT